MANLILMKAGTRAGYDSIATRDSNTLYFCTDTRELFKGDLNFTQKQHIMVSDVIQEPGYSEADVISAVLAANGVSQEALNTGDVIKFEGYVCEKFYKADNSEDTDKNAARATNPIVYMFNGTSWVKILDIVTADKVYFTKDFLAAFKLGQLGGTETTPANIPAKGKSIEALFTDAFVKVNQPTASGTTAASCSESGDKSTNVEYGTKISTVNPNEFKITFSPGSYQYAPTATGITASTISVDTNFKVNDDGTNYKVSNSNATSAAMDLAAGSYNGSLSNVDSEGRIIGKVTATFNYSATWPKPTIVPKTNIGTDADSANVTACQNKVYGNGSYTGSDTFTINVYKKHFYGTNKSLGKTITITNGFIGEKAVATSTEITSAFIKSLTSTTTSGLKDTNAAKTQTFAGMQQMYFAAPAGVYSSVTVKNNTTGLPVQVYQVNFGTTAAPNYKISVSGLNDTALDYNVWVVNDTSATADSNTFAVTFA